MEAFQIFDVRLEGKNLVEASAGTGKTYNITSLYIRALLEKDLEPSQILVLTYTENATAELKHRIRERIQNCISVLEGSDAKDDAFLIELKNRASKTDVYKLKKALFSFDESVVSTIHGFCQKLLREYNLEFRVQSDFEILTNISDQVQEAVDDFWRNEIKTNSNSELGRGFIELLNEWKIDPEKLNTLVQNIISKPYGRLLPDESSEVEIKRKENHIETLFASLKLQLNKDKSALDAIINSGKLDKRSYKEHIFDSLIKDCESWLFDNSAIPLVGYKGLENLGASKLIKSANKGYEPEPPVFSYVLDEYLEAISDLEIVRLEFLKRMFKQTFDSVVEQKKKQNALSFDDLLQVVEGNLTNQLIDKISSQYPFALVDEFQDTDPIQYSIFSKIFSKNDSVLFMIGDPKQAIYGFRGADLFTYFKATQEVKESSRFSLTHNYRSTEPVISATNKLFNRFRKPFVFEEPIFRDSHFPSTKENETLTFNGELWTAFSFINCGSKGTKPILENEIASYVTKQILELLNKNFKIEERYIEPKDIAILVKTKKEAELIKQYLGEEGIQCALKSKKSVFDSEESKDILIMLTTLHNLGNKAKIRALLTTSFIGFNAQKLLQLKSNDNDWAKISDVLKKANDAWGNKGILAAFNELDNFFDIKLRLSALNNAERRITNIEHILELLTNQEHINHLSKGALIRFLKKTINSDENETQDEEIIRLESDSELVTVSTLHASKGLEYAIVFTPFLWSNFLKSSNKNINYTEYHNTDNDLCINLSKDIPTEILLQSNKEKLADALRLNYVAFTRAKYACFIPYVYFNDLVKSPLFFTICDPELYSNVTTESELISLFEEQLALLNNDSNIQICTANEILSISNLEQKRKVGDDDTLSSKLTVRDNHRNNLFDFSKIVSFSSLTSNNHSFEDSAKDIDKLMDAVVQKDEESNTEEYTIHSFPKGATTGNLLHYIFENIQFNEPKTYQEVIAEQLQIFEFDENWESITINWINDCLKHKLLGDLCLQNLLEQDVLKEMEFHFPVHSINSSLLTQIVREKEDGISIEDYSGFMKGFIDLIFQHNDKYYILDYKSNYLGKDTEAYAPKFLKEAMLHSNYDLQYHIYTVALTIYLEQRLPDFDYDRDFGGVFYFFLRGCDLSSPTSGVYFDKPSKSKVVKLRSKMEQEK